MYLMKMLIKFCLVWYMGIDMMKIGHLKIENLINMI